MACKRSTVRPRSTEHNRSDYTDNVGTVHDLVSVQLVMESCTTHDHRNGLRFSDYDSHRPTPSRNGGTVSDRYIRIVRLFTYFLFLIFLAIFYRALLVICHIVPCS